MTCLNVPKTSTFILNVLSTSLTDVYFYKVKVIKANLVDDEMYLERMNNNVIMKFKFFYRWN